MTAFSAAVERDNATSGAGNNPAMTAAASYRSADSLVKLAGLYRTVPSGGQDIDAWGVNLSGKTRLWQGGTLQASRDPNVLATGTENLTTVDASI